ncbi:MAG: 3-methyl-2-oxobutanoate dehydrogenase subunit beta, partial [Clostridia bacterium]|nr:3-methyl-2-oxobutanoate dehydrogenase subunit beta [Clostridia bacterium]
ANGHGGKRKKNIVNSLFIDPQELENSVMKRYERYKTVEEKEVKYEEYMTDDADIVLVAFGITARICKSAIAAVRKDGIKAGLLRPITLWPFPKKEIGAIADLAKVFLTVEMNMGQMVDDVRLAVNGKKPVDLYTRTGGMIPSVDEVEEKIRAIAAAL